MATKHLSSWPGISKTLGPGILLAAAAIGGSHLVQSTKAGAIYGFGLIWAVVLANLFKYPFFDYCRRYTVATGDTILDGYKKQGPFSLYSFFIISVVSAYLNITALIAVSAGLASQLFTTAIGQFSWSLIVCAVCLGLLVFGRYAALDLATKIIVALLGVSTMAAFAMAVVKGAAAPPDFHAPPIWSAAGLTFTIALMGWMPAPIDVAVWPSLWAMERVKQTNHTPTLREALFDFNLGYLSAALLALVFLGLGAFVMFGSGELPEKDGVAFSAQLIRLYTASLGGWSFYFIALAAFTCIFSTVLTCFDGYTRSVHSAFCLIFGRANVNREDSTYWIIMLSFAAVGLIVIQFFMTTMGALVEFAMIVAFLTAPVLAMINHLLIFGPHTPKDFRPGLAMRLLSYAGIVFLSAFALIFVWFHYFAS